jgi:peptidoglycan/xylan/chitin deacetylase (PgdA/CDA1 family)
MRYRLRRIARRARDRIPPRGDGALVLLYHRVAEVTPDPWRLAVRPEHFDEHVDILARCAQPTTSHGLRSMLATGRIRSGSVLVTFDDGYADLATRALPALRRAGVPATAFIVSGADGRREFWWDALERVLLGPEPLPDTLELTVDGTRHAWTLEPVAAADRLADEKATTDWRAWQAPPTTRHVVYRAVWELLHAAPPRARGAAVDDLLAWAGLDPIPRPSHRTLTDDELTGLADEPLIEIGSHTVTHPSLAMLPIADQRLEVAGSASDLRARLGRPIDAIAYPYGSPKDVGASTIQIARAAGLGLGFTTASGRARPGSDPLAIPRVLVDDVDGEGFARLLWRTAGIRVR